MKKEDFIEYVSEARKQLIEVGDGVISNKYTINEANLMLLSMIASLQILTIEVSLGIEERNERLENRSYN